MLFDIALPGNNHIPGTPEWTWSLTSADWKRILKAVDGLGLNAVTTSEHFAMPYETVPRLGPYWQHALSVMAFLAAATDHLRIDATVLVLPYHHPWEGPAQDVTGAVLDFLARYTPRDPSGDPPEDPVRR